MHFFSYDVSLISKIFNLFNITFIILCSYFIMVYFYLRKLTRKHLNPVDRTEFMNKTTRPLKTNSQVKQSFINKEVINILVLTGGGMRGYIPLQVLIKLEELTGKKAGELFDFKAGSSAGAINCALMSIPGVTEKYAHSAKDIAHTYLRNCRKMFAAPWYHKIITFFGLLGPRYLPTGKLKVIHKYFKDLTLADIETNLLIPVYDIADNSLKVIRNWEPTFSQQYTNYLLRDLIHGASNPPMLFSPRAFLVNGKKSVFIDPGLIINNPAEIALMNAWFMFPNKKLRLVLIGNGGDDAEHYGYNHMAEFGAYGLFQYLINSPVINTKFSIDRVHEYIHQAHDYGLNVDFVYINTAGGNEMGTSNTSNENMAKIKKFAEKMLAENAEKISELAKNLM